MFYFLFIRHVGIVPRDSLVSVSSTKYHYYVYYMFEDFEKSRRSEDRAGTVMTTTMKRNKTVLPAGPNNAVGIMT